ncbi:MAG TPA: helix-turn-helix domain-containing protein, partial [Nitrosopumilaceae archaeon]|nr:helix-turn-helix domain-containing protein [Nitrosopumilaceae archaeon]
MRTVNHNSNSTLSQQEISTLDININILTGSEVLVYNHLLGMGNITNRIFLSQTYLAYKLGLCRATINRALRRLAELNLIQKIDRGWKEERTRIKKTCYYLISKLFDLPEIRKRYQGKFKSLIYLKLITNFDQIIESGYKHYVEIVTGIKSSLSFLFKNKEVDNLGYRGNRIRRRRQGIREGLKQEVSNLTIEEGSKMSEFIQNLGGFNEAAKLYLSAYREDIVKEAIKGLGKYKPTGNPWAYFLKILARVSQSKQIEPDYGIINSVTGHPQLTLPITSPSIIASSSKPGFKK